MEVYGVVAVLGALCNLGIGVWIYRKSPQSKIVKRFFLVTLLIGAWGIAEGSALIISRGAMWLTRLSYIPFFIMPSELYHLVYHISEHGYKIPYYLSKALCIPFIAIILTNRFIHAGTSSLFEPGTLFVYLAAIHLVLVVAVFTLLYAERMKFKKLRKIHRVDVMMQGFMFSMAFAYIFEVFSPLLGWGLPKIGSLFALFSTVAFKYSYVEGSPIIYPVQNTLTLRDALCGSRCSLCSSFQTGRCKSCAAEEEEQKQKCPIYVCAKEKGINCHQCGQITRCQIYIQNREQCPFLHHAGKLPVGGSYRVDSPDYEVARTIFRDQLIKGDFGLVVSREHPDIFFRDWDIDRVPMIWLAINEENSWSVSPTDLAKLTHMISTFIEEYPVCCVLFEGFEFLMVHNTFDTIMKFLYCLDDRVVQQQCRFILSYDGRAFDKENLAVLEKELKNPSDYTVE
ncbi:MAG: DUF835 domain-containing protein [Theionarchaea archaeon]|nr:DUF835 domain-containing protein [Theionarchaea archaeon]MBU7000894.1 DUF835 domain-containing protein [Theionarchaea archaeon]MBU7019893.1 DUF835 domain-containing protein [Theionarchaea archaeon]MBU7035970.1 DUF835 domain-containing protein [Theionarchaea archaeon]MBU7041814.1 DUF835 domain-containing protein [Theionarchaea archaeon]